MHFLRYVVPVLTLCSGLLLGQESHEHHKNHTVGKFDPVVENLPPPGFGKVDHVIEIETLRGRMRYDQERFTVGPGSKVKLVLGNNDDMPHNLVLCKPSIANVGMEVSKKAWALGGDAIAKHYVPVHPAILFTRLWFRLAVPNPSISRLHQKRVPTHTYAPCQGMRST